MSIPYLVYYRDKNPNYGKAFTMDDVPEDNNDLYGHLLGDAMTLGRYLPPYEEWNPQFRERSLPSLNEDAKIEWTIFTMAILDEDDLQSKLKQLDPNVVRFVDKDLQSKFLKLKETI